MVGSMKEMRDTALSTARSIIIEKQLEMTLEVAEKVLDDFAREHPAYYAGYWWLHATENQYKLFKREWKKHRPDKEGY